MSRYDELHDLLADQPPAACVAARVRWLLDAAEALDECEYDDQAEAARAAAGELLHGEIDRVAGGDQR